MVHLKLLATAKHKQTKELSTLSNGGWQMDLWLLCSCSPIVQLDFGQTQGSQGSTRQLPLDRVEGTFVCCLTEVIDIGTNLKVHTSK